MWCAALGDEVRAHGDARRHCRSSNEERGPGYRDQHHGGHHYFLLVDPGFPGELDLENKVALVDVEHAIEASPNLFAQLRALPFSVGHI